MERPRTNSEYLRRQNQPKVGGKDLNNALKQLSKAEQEKIKATLERSARISQFETERKNFALLQSSTNDEADKTGWFYKIRELTDKVKEVTMGESPTSHTANSGNTNMKSETKSIAASSIASNAVIESINAYKPKIPVELVTTAAVAANNNKIASAAASARNSASSLVSSGMMFGAGGSVQHLPGNNGNIVDQNIQSNTVGNTALSNKSNLNSKSISRPNNLISASYGQISSNGVKSKRIIGNNSINSSSAVGVVGVSNGSGIVQQARSNMRHQGNQGNHVSQRAHSHSPAGPYTLSTYGGPESIQSNARMIKSPVNVGGTRSPTRSYHRGQNASNHASNVASNVVPNLDNLSMTSSPVCSTTQLAPSMAELASSHGHSNYQSVHSIHKVGMPGKQQNFSNPTSTNRLGNNRHHNPNRRQSMYAATNSSCSEKSEGSMNNYVGYTGMLGNHHNHRDHREHTQYDQRSNRSASSNRSQQAQIQRTEAAYLMKQQNQQNTHATANKLIQNQGVQGVGHGPHGYQQPQSISSMSKTSSTTSPLKRSDLPYEIFYLNYIEISRAESSSGIYTDSSKNNNSVTSTAASFVGEGPGVPGTAHYSSDSNTQNCLKYVRNNRAHMTGHQSHRSSVSGASIHSQQTGGPQANIQPIIPIATTSSKSINESEAMPNIQVHVHPQNRYSSSEESIHRSDRGSTYTSSSQQSMPIGSHSQRHSIAQNYYHQAHQPQYQMPQPGPQTGPQGPIQGTPQTLHYPMDQRARSRSPSVLVQSKRTPKLTRSRNSSMDKTQNQNFDSISVHSVASSRTDIRSTMSAYDRPTVVDRFVEEAYRGSPAHSERPTVKSNNNRYGNFTPPVKRQTLSSAIPENQVQPTKIDKNDTSEFAQFANFPSTLVPPSSSKTIPNSPAHNSSSSSTNINVSKKQRFKSARQSKSKSPSSQRRFSSAVSAGSMSGSSILSKSGKGGEKYLRRDMNQNRDSNKSSNSKTNRFLDILSLSSCRSKSRNSCSKIDDSDHSDDRGDHDVFMAVPDAIPVSPTRNLGLPGM